MSPSDTFHFIPMINLGRHISVLHLRSVLRHHVRVMLRKGVESMAIALYGNRSRRRRDLHNQRVHAVLYAKHEQGGDVDAPGSNPVNRIFPKMTRVKQVFFRRRPYRRERENTSEHGLRQR